MAQANFPAPPGGYGGEAGVPRPAGAGTSVLCRLALGRLALGRPVWGQLWPSWWTSFASGSPSCAKAETSGPAGAT